MSDTLILAVVQHACGDDPAANLDAAVAAVAEAGARGARLVLLPELHNTRYFCRTEDPAAFDLAEPVPGPTTERLGEAARAAGAVVVGSVFERRAAGLYHNTAVVLDTDGRLAGRYRKAHIPDDPGYYEKFYFTPGDTGFEPIDTAVGLLGVLVCWDQWYPEAARLMALAGAQVLLYPSAIGWDPADDEAERERQLRAWQGVQRGHAIANCLPLAAANRIGDEDDTRFWGHGFIAGPQGEMLAEGGIGPEILTAELDLSRTDTLRRMWPFLRDRRIDAYGDLALRFRDW
ncbi:putative amidohydrolase [Salinisphaera sp. PC39]|uniref:carbon-nitrogen hydrolase n=1 Tax=Salinisphaera sp. PC39 TaxID=1304156 RepID=UPI003340DA0B